MDKNRHHQLCHLGPDHGFVLLGQEFDRGNRPCLYIYSKFQPLLHIGLQSLDIHLYLDQVLLVLCFLVELCLDSHHDQDNRYNFLELKDIDPLNLIFHHRLNHLYPNLHLFHLEQNLVLRPEKAC